MNPVLKDLQSAFKRHLMERDPAIADHIVGSGSLGADVRLAIYGNAYYARLIESLEQDYEVLYVLLGDEDFTRLCTQYIDTYPSKFPSLRWFGQYMAEYLGEHLPYSDHPYLQEMAVFEWTFIEAFDAENAPIATEMDAAQVPPDKWPELEIKLHPSVHWFGYEWNILPLWKAATNDESIPDLAHLGNKEYCIVWRQDLTTQYRTMDADEVVLLRGVQNNNNFAQLCEHLTEFDMEPGQVPMRAATILKTWITQGMVSKLQFD
jgi:hypothetical protein